MLKSHEKFYSANGKRQILIAEDEQINRELLGFILDDEYEILFATNGAETVDMIRRNQDTLSLVLLDILMPIMSGLEVLKVVRQDEMLSKIPVIVMTAEKEAEVESLKLGAIDFIPKPYPDAGVIQARILRTIELSEDRAIIQSTERDELTGLYNREYFYRFAQQFDQFHKDLPMDAILVDVNHFHMINERYGRAYGDEILRRIGRELKELVSKTEGIVCHRLADTFMCYCPHREDYPEIMEKFTTSLSDDSTGNRIRLRLGIYANVDKTLSMERRFDRAKMAADTVRGSYANSIGYYDNDLHDRQLYAEQLLEDFPAAIEEKQFQVYYQPKFDVRPEVPILTSAEALVRWMHPKLGMISPGVFIPLFEDNGLIQRLDQYVWRETARQVREWKNRLGYSVAVSVNVSRINMYDSSLPDTFLSILREFKLTGLDIFLEVTESAYTQDSVQIIEMVERLREIGFRIEMDDFGTGYSSLNMISRLPIDALKLDMQFIREAFKEGGNTHMLEVIIGIADFLEVPVVAEGVETEDQLRALKTLGCDIVQGYFFSRPVASDEFEPFILQKKEAEYEAILKTEEENEREETFEADHEILENKLDELHEKKVREGRQADQDDESKEEENTGFRLHLKTASILFVILSLIAAAALLTSDILVTRGYLEMKEASDKYISAEISVSDMESGSDYLTDRVRCFVVTGNVTYLEDFFKEVEVTRRRDKAVDNLEELLGGSNNNALTSLNTALQLSNELINIEERAMKLMVESGDYDQDAIPEAIREYSLTSREKGLSDEEKKEKARQLVFDYKYMRYKERIRGNVNKCAKALIRRSSEDLEESSHNLALLVNIHTLLTIVFLLMVVILVVLITLLVRKPLSQMIQKMQNQETIPPRGVEELQFVTRTYNKILKENREARERLRHEASHDPLTGLFNRGAYDLLMNNADPEHMALILIDVDHFKTINDTYGHAVGDRVLKRLAKILKNSFRSVDILCRIGGDEFAVVMTRVNSSMRQIVLNKIQKANKLLLNPKDDLPPVSISVGVAFSDRKNPQGDIFHDADAALYRVKQAGRSGCEIFE